jgi:hypothetical protein
MSPREFLNKCGAPTYPSAFGGSALECALTAVLAILSFLAGMLLGQHLRVFALVPAICIALVGVISVGLARADDGWTIILTAICVTIALQAGYLVNIVIHRVVSRGTAADLAGRSERRPSR